jgi:hypothetical protein
VTLIRNCITEYKQVYGFESFITEQTSNLKSATNLYVSSGGTTWPPKHEEKLFPSPIMSNDDETKLFKNCIRHQSGLLTRWKLPTPRAVKYNLDSADIRWRNFSQTPREIKFSCHLHYRTYSWVQMLLYISDNLKLTPRWQFPYFKWILLCGTSQTDVGLFYYLKQGSGDEVKVVMHYIISDAICSTKFDKLLCWNR